MKLENLDLLSLQAWYMQHDPVIKAFCQVLEIDFKEIAKALPSISEWNQIDNYNDELLDELAWEYHIDWYDSTVDEYIKKKLLKNSDKVHMRLGTPWAVEQVVTDFFGDSSISEWFEYGGEPHFFRIFTGAPLKTYDDYMKFMGRLEKIKRKSSWLEFMQIKPRLEEQIYIGGAVMATFTYQINHSSQII